MNERIKQLALEAGAGLSCIAEPLEHPWKFSESELEKFAELIVSECIMKINGASIRGESYDTLADNIKTDFGVEQ